MMERYENVLEATETATHSQGSAMRENERYMNSYEAKINLMKNAWTETTISMQDAFLGDAIVSFTTITTDAIKVLTSFVDTFGLLPPVFAIAGLAISGFKTKIYQVTFGDMIKEFKTMINSTRALEINMTKGAASAQLYAAGMSAANVATRLFSRALHFLSRAILPMAIFATVGYTISKLTEKFVESRQRAEELKKELEEFKELNISAVSTNKGEVEELLNTYKRLNNERESLGEFTDVTKEREYLDVQNQLADIFPAIVSHVDAKGQAHLKSAEGIEKEIEKTEQLIEAERKLRIAQSESDINEKIAELEEKRKEVEKLLSEDPPNPESFYGDGSFADTILGLTFLADSVSYYKKKIFGLSDEDKAEARLLELELNTHYENIRRRAMEAFDDMTSHLGQTTPVIKDKMSEIFSSLDFEEIDGANILKIATELSSFTHIIEELLEKEDIDNLEKVIQALNTHLGELGVKEIAVDFEELRESIDKYNTIQELANALMSEGSDEAEEYSESLDNVAETVKKLSDEQQEMFDDYNTYIGIIEDLNNVLNELDSDEGLSTKSIGTLIEYHRDLLPFLDDEIKLREMINEKIEENANIAVERYYKIIAEDDQYYTTLVENNNEYINKLADNYEVDLKNFDNISQMKLAVEKQTLQELVDMWNQYVSGVTATTEDFAKLVGDNGILTDYGREWWAGLGGAGEEGRRIQREFGKHLANYGKSIKEITIDFNRIGELDLSSATSAFKGLTNHGRKAAKSAKDTAKEHKLSAFVADTYAKALEQVNSQLQRQKDLTSEFPKHSEEYRKSLEAEIKLLKAKSGLIESQSKELARQIKSGNIQQYGVVDSGSVWEYKSGSGGGSSSGVASYYLDNFRVTSGFGRRNAPTAGASSYHKGIDLARGRAGDPVKALASGKVTQAYYSNSGGYMVVLQQDDGIVSKYMHMQKGLNVKAGQRVSAGQQLGRVGSTGYSTGPHLHLQLERGGQAFDPLPYLKSTKGGTSTSNSSSKSKAQIQAEASRAEAQRQSDVDRAMSDLLRMEDEATQIQNQINQLFFEIVESFLEEFDHNRNKLNKKLAEIDYYQLREDEGSKEWMKYQLQREEVMREQNKIHKDSIKWLEREIKNNKNLTKAQRMRLDDKLIERQQEMWNLERTILDERVKMANQLMDVYKQALNAQKDAAVKMIDDMIKEIDEAERESDYRKRLEKEQKSRQEILDEISQWSIDDSDRARKKLKELTEQLQELDETIEDMQHDKAIEDRKNALNEEKEAVNERFDNLINDEKAFAKMRSDIIKGNTKSLAKELNSMFKEVGKMTEDLGKSVVSNLQRAIQQMNYYIQDPKFKNMKIPHFDTGGMVRASSKGGLIVAHDKEIVLNRDDTKNLLDIVKTARNIPRDLLRNIKIPKLPSQPVTTSGGDTVYDIDLHVGSLNGTKDDARFVLGEIVKGVKKKGGKL